MTGFPCAWAFVACPDAGGGVFHERNAHLGADEIMRTVRRLAHEIIENNHGTEGLVLVGLLSRGYPLAQRLATAIAEFEGPTVPVGSLDIGLYRDDVARRATSAVAAAQHPAEHRWRDRRPRGRCAVHRPKRARGHGRPCRLWTAGTRAAGRAHGPRPSRVADPAGLRGQEPADRRCPASEGAAVGNRRRGCRLRLR